jgi:isopenicillin N synthase-like dioxygenase
MADRIPVIDLSMLSGGDQGGRRAVAAEIDAACREIGFLVVSGHGVDEALQRRLYGAARAFFDLPMERKLMVRRPRHDQNRGYIPYGEEALALMHGGDTPPDYKEVFTVGPIDPPDDEYHSEARSYPNFAPNLWPVEPAGLRPAMVAYFAAMEGLSGRLTGALALALGLSEDWFRDKLDRHTSHLRLLHYPAPDAELAPGQLRCGAHTDLGAITILRNEAAAGGLQVRMRGGAWIDAPALPGTFLVNIGDLLMRWSNDVWVSTPHRVAVPRAAERDGSRRLSIAYFLRPNYDAPIACIPACADAAHPPKYPPTTVQDYSVARFNQGAGPRRVA